MKKYRIKVDYSTGDSFHTEDTSDLVEMDWNDLDIAKENLKRIEEHYKWYTYHNKSYSRFFNDKKIDEPLHHIGLEYDFQIRYKLDDGTEFFTTCPWCGYFENLQCAEIVVNPEINDMKFTLK